jgi:hypothetical protein
VEVEVEVEEVVGEVVAAVSYCEQSQIFEY